MASLCSIPVILTLLVIAYLISKGIRHGSEDESGEDELSYEDLVMLDMIDEHWDKKD